MKRLSRLPYRSLITLNDRLTDGVLRDVVANELSRRDRKSPPKHPTPLTTRAKILGYRPEDLSDLTGDPL